MINKEVNTIHASKYNIDILGTISARSYMRLVAKKNRKVNTKKSQCKTNF